MTKLLGCLLFALSAGLPVQTWAQEASGKPVDSAVAAAPAPTAGSENNEIAAPDVYRRVAQVRREIDLIRMEMGRAEVEPPPVQIASAAPREVYYQALTLFRKAGRLAFEHSREEVRPPQMPAGQLQPADVGAMVDAAYERILVVKQKLGIDELSELPELDPGMDASRVYQSILSANRELNNLLDQRFAPADVYQEVTVAIAYLSRLLDSPGAVSTPPDAPPLERRKRPADVYRKLVECFDAIRQIGERSGVAMLTLSVDDALIDEVEPSDVYDLSVLLVSELAHLHRKRAKAKRPRMVYDPGRKLPSDVYQRLGVLAEQLKMLQTKVENNSDWLND